MSFREKIYDGIINSIDTDDVEKIIDRAHFLLLRPGHPAGQQQKQFAALYSFLLTACRETTAYEQQRLLRRALELLDAELLKINDRPQNVPE